MSHEQPVICVRRLCPGDLPDALAIQLEVYPAYLLKDEDVLASRLELRIPYCLGATANGALVAYLLAHGWPSQSPPPLGALLSRDLPDEILYIHDLAVRAAGRGLGIGRELVKRAFHMAAHDGLRTAELIAVEGAAGYWRTLGFAEPAIPSTLRAKLDVYGRDARWMSRTISSPAVRA